MRLALSEIDRAYHLRGSRPKWVISDLASRGADIEVRITADRTRNRDARSVLAPIDALVAGVDRLQREPEVPSTTRNARWRESSPWGSPAEASKKYRSRRSTEVPGSSFRCQSPFVPTLSRRCRARTPRWGR
ncbi:hypothetical protein GCM10009550_57940 [Actinocorallia libanotica]|uniref:Uncharacterized protein n=1 Tax=Actinocorallia libanotica TaxID=46162 RepID=A0ABN1RSU1_9ACTN